MYEINSPSPYILLSAHVVGLNVETYDFRESLLQDMTDADLIISHCGAGSILEILTLQKASIGVINEDLMDNHQHELAEAMRGKGLMKIADHPSNLKQVLEDDLVSANTMQIGSSSVLLDELCTLISL
jgi:UDP-N-acetylglucosamine transferase subunit ALG13